MQTSGRPKLAASVLILTVIPFSMGNWHLRPQSFAVRFPQHSVSFNAMRGTLRGMHYQRAPHQETKLVSCTGGAIFDVCLDLRPNSPTFRKWRGVELSAENGRQFLIPVGCAHGFQALTDNVTVRYLISTPHDAEAATGVRYDDPAFAISWPLEVTQITEKDRAWPDFRP